MDEQRLKKAIELAQIATEKDQAGQYEQALQYYKNSLDHWHLVCKYQTNSTLKHKLYEKMEPYVTRAEAIKEYLKTKESPITVVSNGTAGSKTKAKDDNDDNDIKTEQNKLKNSIADVIVTERPNIRWEDVAGLTSAKSALQEAVILPTRFPQLFVGKRKPWKGILLYGPPGTGKTYLAKACANEASATFLCVSSADLVSKWQGESEKLVRMLFKTAREKPPAIIFIDEVDSLCGARSDRESESSKRIKTEFLVQMEGIQEDDMSKRVLILGATNEPWSLDAAIRRRFERRIYISLPDAEAREQMIKLHIGNTPHSLSEVDFKYFAERTERFSGADISVFVRDALFEPIRRCRSATHFKKSKIDSDVWVPCNEDDPDPTKEKKSLMSIPQNKLIPPELTKENFQAVIDRLKPTVSLGELKRYVDWTNQFGFDGQ